MKKCVDLSLKSAKVTHFFVFFIFGLMSFTGHFSSKQLGLSSAHANPFFVGRFNGLLGGPLDHSAFALYWNPANLYTEKIDIDLHLGLIGRQASYNRTLPMEATPEEKSVNGGLATTSALGLVPSIAFHSGIKFNEKNRLGYGAGVYIARAGTADWDRHPDASNQYPGAYDGPQRWSALSTFMLLVNYSAGASFESGPFAIGAAVSYIDTALSTTKAATALKTDDLMTEGRIFLDNAKGQEVNATFGANFKLDDIELGYSWRLPVTYNLKGRAYILYGDAAETNVKASIELQVAESHLASAAYQFDDLRVRLEYERQLWSIMKNQEIRNIDKNVELLLLERNFKDTNAYRLRLDYDLTDKVQLNTGISYEEGVTPQEYHEPGLAEADQVEVGVGLTFPLTTSLSLHTTFFYQHFFDQTINNSKQSPTTNGDYTDHRQYLTLNLQWSI